MKKDSSYYIKLMHARDTHTAEHAQNFKISNKLSHENCFIFVMTLAYVEEIWGLVT